MRTKLAQPICFGRQIEFDEAAELLRSTESRMGGIVLVSGAPWIGKTLFMEKLTEIAIQQSFTIMNFSGIDTEQPTVEIMSTHRTSLSTTRIEIALGEQLQRQIEAQVVHGPVLVAVDDLHNANRKTRNTIELLIESLHRRPVLWTLASHTDDGNPMEMQRSYFPIDRTYVARLRPLADGAVLALVEHLVGACPEADLIALTARAEGNPRLITDLILGLLSEGRIDLSGATARLHSSTLPERLITTVRQRLDGLSPTCRQLVTVAAMLAKVVALDDVAEMLSETPAGLLPVLEEATYQGLLVVRGESMTFASELLWLAIRCSISLPVANALQHQAEGLPHAAVPARFPPPTLVRTIPAETERDDDRSIELNEAEWEIVGLVRQGMTNTQIASRLVISRHTVSYHLRKIYRRLNVVSRAELVGLV